MFTYPGSELEVFAKAHNWKRYIRRMVGPYLGQQVLEVGAGNGATTAVLCDGSQSRWLCLEPDEQLAAMLARKLWTGELPSCCESRLGMLGDLSEAELFDTALYIDVLEHIEDAAIEVARVGEHLVCGGHLVVLAPAHQWLYSPFDAAIGHYRRYTRRALLELTSARLRPVLARYMDAAGLVASLSNRLLLRAANPTAAQIRFWDQLLVPISRVMDPLLCFRMGKSVIVVWRNQL
jgi:hypothetical protein